ncbi:MAG: hypothetical protein JSU91_05465 [Thermoplasmatales archaeon]|nr:MAG: hypothetical protein JSU91_05465 [Thermoplasmatales archaeon]
MMQDIDYLKALELDILLDKSWNIRKKNFSPLLSVSTPSQKTYISEFHKNKKYAFVNISVTGTDCALNCEHCKRSLLDDMIPVENENELKVLGEKLIEKGCEGALISGGATSSGEVPLDKYFNAISYLKSKGLKIIVHTGLAPKNTARKLKNAGVDQVLLDIIGDEETIEKVYHLQKKPVDFLRTMQFFTEENLDLAPHILIGIHFGRIVGEYNAIRMVTQIKPKTIVLVILSPRSGTPMDGVETPPSKEIGKITAITRILNPEAHLTLGCARPASEDKVNLEKYAVRAGINGIAYPTDETIKFAQDLGLRISFKDTCCSII